MAHLKKTNKTPKQAAKLRKQKHYKDAGKTNNQKRKTTSLQKLYDKTVNSSLSLAWFFIDFVSKQKDTKISNYQFLFLSDDCETGLEPDSRKIRNLLLITPKLEHFAQAITIFENHNSLAYSSKSCKIELICFLLTFSIWHASTTWHGTYGLVNLQG